jgi:uncharacterized protein (TIGR02285 family)
MTLRRRLAIVGVALLASAGIARAEDARPTVTWVMAVPPPIHIVSPSGATGYADQTLAWFTERLPGFRHEVIGANSNRLQEMIAAADGVCGGAMLKTPEREATIQFSRPVYWMLPNRLIVSAERPAALDAHLDAQGEVDLPALLADRSFTGGVQQGRSYSPEIDRALAGAAGLVSIRGPGHFDMLASGRFDWTIGFPIEGFYWARRLENSPEKTDFLADLGGTNLAYLSRPIAGNTALMPGYIGCSKGPIGRRVIAELDRLIEAAGPNPPWLRFYLAWLDGSDRAEYLQAREALPR